MRIFYKIFSPMPFLLMSTISWTASAADIAYVSYYDLTSENNGYVAVVDTATDSVLTTITVGKAPQSVAYVPELHQAYVANQRSNSISVIDTITNTVIATVPTLGPIDIAVSADGKRAYISNFSFNSNLGSYTVSVLDTASNNIVDIIRGDSLSSPERIVSAAEDDSKIYVNNYSNSTISEINTVTNQITDVIAVPENTNIIDMALSPAGDKLYVAQNPTGIMVRKSFISVIDTKNNEVIKTIDTNLELKHIALSADGEKLFGTSINFSSDHFSNVAIIDMVTDEITEITVDFYPDQIALPLDSSKAYVTNAWEKGVFVLDTSSQVSGPITSVDFMPSAVAIIED